jgi:hypothetical protein
MKEPKISYSTRPIEKLSTSTVKGMSSFDISIEKEHYSALV